MDVTLPTRPGLLSVVGRTPLVELRHLAPKPGVRLLAKLEGQNPSGSIKDRIALALVEQAEARGELKPGDTIVEASTGNTGIAVAMVARQRGYQLKVVIPHGVVPSIRDVLELLGVEILWVEPYAGMRGAIETARALARTRGWFPLNQFGNALNVQTHYACTGTEIAEAAGKVDAFVAGIGTGGTIMGVSTRLREDNPDLQVIGVEPKMGEHLQGLRSLEDGYRPPLLDLDALSGRFLVSAARALEAAHQVASTEGILAGVSSGAALHAALRVAERMDEGTIVVMFSDGGWKYLPARPWGAARRQDPNLDETHWW
ncbi:MAG: cysteine synthase family protein [Alphaproteobacteria bacterium]|nr:cysteine synthase family protein [Alphaproteobacteria bacterium]